MKNALIIFVKNPVLGKVKTRLARTVGDEKALTVYQKLLAHTEAVCSKVNAVCFVFYSDYIEEKDSWDSFEKRVQESGDLGAKMQAACSEILGIGSTRAIIVGSDCLEITTGIIDRAFASLNEQEVVIGPATDGGYYLLGMKKMHPTLFQNKDWSTDKVLQQTLDSLVEKNLSFYLLPVLNDIDEEKDLAGTLLVEE